MRKSLFSGAILFFMLHNLTAQTSAQNKAQLKTYKNNPVWIAMMDDPNVNYNEAKFAFETFWDGKPTPESIMEGEEEENESEERNIFQRIIKSDKQYKKEIVQYAGDHKKFNYWLREHAPYVKENGSLMNENEIQSLIHQELENRKASNQ
jgi:hypothetical protein